MLAEPRTSKTLCWGKSTGRVQGVHTPLPLRGFAGFQYSYTKSAVSFDIYSQQFTLVCCCLVESLHLRIPF